MDYRFHNREKVRVKVDGASTDAGHIICGLLREHPWFKLEEKDPNVIINALEEPFIQLKAGGKEVTLIPEVNGTQLSDPARVTHPSAGVSSAALALHSLHKSLRLTRIHVTTFLPVDQSPSMDLLDSVLPIQDTLSVKLRDFVDVYTASISFRLNISRGVMQHICVGFAKKPHADDILHCWKQFSGDERCEDLPNSPRYPLVYQEVPNLKRDRDGKSIVVGKLQESALYDYQFLLVANSSKFSSAGGVIRNLEYLLKAGYIFW